MTKKIKFITTILLLFIIATILFSLNIGGYDLWPADEPRYAQISREILQTNEWVCLHVNGQPYDEKPPLLFWAIAIISKPFGDVNEITARIPSVIAAVGTLGVTFLLTTQMYDLQTAIWAIAILATTTRFFWQARTCQTDMLLTASLTIALWCLYSFIRSKNKKWLLIFYGAITAALYTKGPPGLIFPLLCVYTLFWKNKDERKQLHLFWGYTAAILFILVWLIPARVKASATGNTVAQQVIFWDILFQTLGRFALGVSKAQGPWYYFINLPIDLLPWSIFLPVILPWVWKNRQDNLEMRLLLSWIVPAFIFFSISIGKRQIYLLPIFPAIAIVFARSLLHINSSKELNHLRIAGNIWGMFLIILGLGIFVVSFLDKLGNYSFRGSELRPLTIILLLCGPLILYTSRSTTQNSVPLYRTLAGTTTVLFGALALVVFPFLNPHKSAREFCEPIRNLAEKKQTFALYSFGFSREEYIFYSKTFHEPVFTETLPVNTNNHSNWIKLARAQKKLREKMINAVMKIPIASYENISQEELTQLQQALHSAIYTDTSPEQQDFLKQFEQALLTEVHHFSQKFFAATPAFMFIQEQDYRWLVAIEPAFQQSHILRHQSVGRREVLLLANPSANNLTDN